MANKSYEIEEVKHITIPNQNAVVFYRDKRGREEDLCAYTRERDIWCPHIDYHLNPDDIRIVGSMIGIQSMEEYIMSQQSQGRGGRLVQEWEDIFKLLLTLKMQRYGGIVLPRTLRDGRDIDVRFLMRRVSY